MSGVHLLQAGTEALAWSEGGLTARGLGSWRWHPSDGRWRPAPPPLGASGVEVHDGLLVGATSLGRRGRGVLRAGERLLQHPPSGALAVGTEVARAVAAAGRSLQSLPWALRLDTLRFDEGGERVAGIAEDGTTRVLHLLTRSATVLPGVPLHPDVWLDASGALCTATTRRAMGLAEASCALSGSRLAGPGTRVWDLSSGEPLTAPGTIALGATCPWHDGFVTVDWESHRGWSVLAEPLAFRLPLDDDDLVVAVAADSSGVRCWSAEGHTFSVDGSGEVTRQAWSPPPRRQRQASVQTPAGPLAEASSAVVGTRRYAWSASGWLLGWIDSPSTSGNS